MPFGDGNIVCDGIVTNYFIAGWTSRLSRWTHDPENTRAELVPATLPLWENIERKEVN